MDELPFHDFHLEVLAAAAAAKKANDRFVSIPWDPPPPSEGCPMLELPLELRQQIYADLIPNTHIPPWLSEFTLSSPPPFRRDGKSVNSSLLRVNKQLHAEVEAMWYAGEASYGIIVQRDGIHFLDEVVGCDEVWRIPKMLLNVVRRLEIEVFLFPLQPWLVLLIEEGRQGVQLDGVLQEREEVCQLHAMQALGEMLRGEGALRGLRVKCVLGVRFWARVKRFEGMQFERRIREGMGINFGWLRGVRGREVVVNVEVERELERVDSFRGEMKEVFLRVVGEVAREFEGEVRGCELFRRGNGLDRAEWKC